jgi:hypothetical protein
MDCTQYPVSPPKIVAIATEFDWNATHKFADPKLPGSPIPVYGQDLEFGTNGIAPNGQDVGSTEAELKPKMERLLGIFAHKDGSGMARRLFTSFLAKQSQVIYFEDQDLNKAVDAHDRMDYFCRAALGAPWPWGVPPGSGKTRIHQALQAAKWDLNHLVAPTDLGAPVFNEGDKWTVTHLGDSTGDWANGLAVMIDAVQYIYVVATHYHYDQGAYCIKLKYIGLDVFGLDDGDVNRYGASSDDWYHPIDSHPAKVGITAWWQLQHQHGYAPLITRFVVERTYEVPAM